ncbi:hypothetical protein LINGRAHAP2_LOCUS30159, partial [Linum grandiflorum]
QHFQGFLNDLQDWELKLNEKDKRRKPLASDKVSVRSTRGEVGRAVGRRQMGKVGDKWDEDFSPDSFTLVSNTASIIRTTCRLQQVMKPSEIFESNDELSF